jgi:hypothetical protein
MISKILKEVPLETRLNIANRMVFVDLIIKLGYRKDKVWTNCENELLNKLCGLAQEHTDNILKTIKEWEADGKP